MTFPHRFSRVILVISFGLASVCVAGIFVLTTAEVIMRYAFNRPTVWSADLTAYLLCLTVFCALPKISAEGANVAVNIFTDTLTGRARLASRLLVEIVMAVACALAVHMCFHVLSGQYSSGARTVDGIAIPRWMLTAVLLYGFGAAFCCHVARAVHVRSLRDASSEAPL